MATISFFVKPQTVIIGAFIGFWLILVTRSWQKPLIFLTAAVLPILAVWLAYAAAGLWRDYWFWNLTFNQLYGGGLPAGLTTDFFRRLLLTNLWLFPLALLCWQSFRLKQPAAYQYFLLLGVSILSLAFQYPRAGEIHAAAGLPIISIIAGVILRLVWQDRSKSIYALGLSMAALSGIGLTMAISYIPSAAGFGDIISIGELRPVADWVNQHSLPADTLYVLPADNSDSQLHILTNKLPPKTWAIVNEFTLAYPEIENV